MLLWRCHETGIVAQVGTFISRPDSASRFDLDVFLPRVRVHSIDHLQQ